MSRTPSSTPNYTPQLRQLMQTVGLPSLAALYRVTGLPRSHIRRLRQGQTQDLPVRSLLKLSLVLQIPLPELLSQFSHTSTGADQAWSVFQSYKQSDQMAAQQTLKQELSTLKSEYQHLQTRLEQQQQTLQQDLQRTALQTLEPLLLQWPTAAYAARNNPQAPAVKVLPLLRPLEQLLQSWQVEPIGTVGEKVPFDPQWHQLINSTAETNPGERVIPGDPVKVRYVGYRHRNQLLYRAKVSAIDING